MKSNLKYAVLGAIIGGVIVPVMAFAARTAAPILTGLFPSTTLSVNLPSPTISLGNATTTGSVYSNGGSALYFQVTALDGVGESLGSQLLGTSTVNQAHGWQITWTAIQGAVKYRVYFSTSTPQSMTQYFTATSTGLVPNAYYTFTSTSSPTFLSTGVPTANTAYTINLAISGSSWLNGGSIGIGTSTPTNLLSVVNEPLGQGAAATTTILVGDNSTTTSRACFNVVNSAGVAVSFYVSAANAIVVEAKKCL